MTAVALLMDGRTVSAPLPDCGDLTWAWITAALTVAGCERWRIRRVWVI